MRRLPSFTYKPIPEGVQCKGCRSRALVRYGTYNDVQRWKCLGCGGTFMESDTLPHGKVSASLIAEAVSSFYEGLSIDAIRRQLNNAHGIQPSDSTVYQWITRFTKVAVRATTDTKLRVGSDWTADESVLKIGGQNLWFWDCIDNYTRFLLASHITPSRYTRDAQTLMQRAAQRAGKVPKTVTTDKLAAYLDGIEIPFGAYTKHRQGSPFSLDKNTNLIERFHSTLKARTKIMRGLKSRESAKLITDGWLVHYNFFRPHGSLGNLTPGQAASAKFPYKNWQEVIVNV